MQTAPVAAAPAAAPAAGANPYGLFQALHEGGLISWTVFIILVGMSIGTFYILFTKFLQQQKIINQGKKVRASFWNCATSPLWSNGAPQHPRPFGSVHSIPLRS